MDTWKICISEPFLNCEHIFPTKQKYVRLLLDVFQKDENIVAVTIFGSSVTSACNPWSDVDVYITQIENKPLPRLSVALNLDLWTNFSVDNNLYNEIQKKGVLVYDKRPNVI